jgi:hypothetical protein
VVASARLCPPVPPLDLHGKEGVDGSSPSEGSREKPCKLGCVVACSGIDQAARVQNGYKVRDGRALAGTSGHSRPLSPSDLSRGLSDSRLKAPAKQRLSLSDQKRR